MKTMVTAVLLTLGAAFATAGEQQAAKIPRVGRSPNFLPSWSVSRWTSSS